MKSVLPSSSPVCLLTYLLFVNDGSADRRRPYLLATFLQLLPSVLFCFKGMRGFQSSAPLNHVSRLDVSRKTKKHTVWTIKCDTFSKVWVTENLTKRNSVLLLSLVRFSTTQTLDKASLRWEITQAKNMH